MYVTVVPVELLSLTQAKESKEAFFVALRRKKVDIEEAGPVDSPELEP